MKRFASASLALELASAVLLALIISNAATFALFASQRTRDVRFIRLDMAEERLSALAELLPSMPRERQDQYLFSAAGRGARMELGSAPFVLATEPRNPQLENRFRAALAPLAPREVRVAFREGEIRQGSDDHPTFSPARHSEPPMMTADPSGHVLVAVRRFAISAQLPDGRWLNAQFALPRADPATGVLLRAAGFTALALILASLWIAFRFGGPLRRLAEASASLRPGEPIPQVEEEGPAALKDVIRSFNAMSKRLMSTLDGQRAMLAAIAHDLRTPITSLKLRLELIDDTEIRDKMHGSLDELQSVTEAAVDALKAEGAGESTRRVDVAALVESLCTDLAELGDQVSFTAGEPVVSQCRPHEVRRAARNLIENAVRYGGAARVNIAQQAGSVVITVEDDGPGIPPADLERVFEPFQRLEKSRNRETGGHGLGLTIARAIAHGHGGDIEIKNRSGGGLTATFRFPSR